MKLRLPHISGVALAAMMFGTSVTASAVPAYPGKRTYTQPDGTTLTLSLRGDESLHFFVDDNGYLIDRDTNGWFRFIDNDGSLTGIKAGNYDMSATEQANWHPCHRHRHFLLLTAKPAQCARPKLAHPCARPALCLLPMGQCRRPRPAQRAHRRRTPRAHNPRQLCRHQMELQRQPATGYV